MKITSLFAAGAAMFILNSCSDDDATPEVLQPPASFSHFTVTSTTTAPDGSPSAESYSYTENLMDQKRYSVTQDGITTQRYFYAGGLLTQSILGFSFHYDASGKIDKINRMISEEGDDVPVELKYRFVHPQQNVMYCERMVWAEDPTEIFYRNILEFDADGNVVKAGPDSNLDGIMDHYNQFIYANGDLTEVQVWNGTNVQFSYSNVKDNFCLIDDNTYGKQVRRAMCSEYYAGANFETNLGHSAHVLADETPAPDYLLFADGFYQKKTTLDIFDDNSQRETVVEFFVD